MSPFAPKADETFHCQPARRMYCPSIDHRVLGDATRMSEHGNESSRLSGWVRLWIVFTAMSWSFGGLDIAFSIETLQWPSPIGELTPQSLRHLIWFLGPIIIAVAWIAIRWIWLGFQPSVEQATERNMSTTEIASRAFRLARRGIVFSIGLVAIAFLAIVGFVTIEDMEASEMTDTWWGGILITFHMIFVCYIILCIWEMITETTND